MLKKNAPVYIEKCESYDVELLKSKISAIFDAMGIGNDTFEGKKIVIKPNLVRKMDASLGGTTHPAFVQATAAVLSERGASGIVLAESPGGIYTENTLKAAYKVCGMTDVCERAGIKMNLDTSARMCEYENGVYSKAFNIITPFADADVVINLCKLKTHGLTTMTSAVKNYFGTIPGTEKFEMHARFPDVEDFSEMLLDLCAMHAENKTMINIVDAVVGMEGNGPTNGKARKIGLLLAGENPFSLDFVCSKVLCYDNKVSMVKKAAARGYYDSENITVIGEKIDDVKITDFELPSSRKSATSVLTNVKFMRIFEPRPVVDRKKCIGCGECVRSCPKHTIGFVQKGKRRVAKIDHSICIKCFCCQELCPHDAVMIKQNFILKYVK